MDSMRSLNTSLPRSPHKKRSKDPPVQTIQAFKTAALEVANLYRAAASDQQLARQSGYQDALDDLLTFLDRENIGLDDGEGWRVRQWATERLDSNPAAFALNESDDEPIERESRAKSTSPSNQHSGEDETNVKPPSPQNANHTELPVSSTSTHTNSASGGVPSSDEFTFRQPVPFQTDVEMQGSEVSQRASAPSTSRSQPRSALSIPSVRLGVVPRGANINQKAGYNARQGSKSGGSNKTANAATGSKRKITIADLFDIGDLEEFKDIQSGGGKRGRFG